jgi:glycosyltransferase involved in cell wall biosynthesis
MRVDILDPPAYSPPYDAALARALARQGISVRLLTSSFAYGEVPEPDGYARDEFFYSHAIGAPGSRRRTATKLAEHLPDMLRYRRSVPRSTPGSPDVVHVQWLTLPRLDLRLLPSRPTVLTVHDPLERTGARAPIPSHAFARIDAVIVHSDYARERFIEQHDLQASRVHVIRHGALGPQAAGPASYTTAGLTRSLPDELDDDGSPVVLCFGLIRPYKGIETLLCAWRGLTGAQLWIVGRAMTDITPLQAGAPGGVRFLTQFVTTEQEQALFSRADIVVLPYERSDRFGFSGVLATALGYGKAIVLSDIGGLAEVAADGAAQLVPPSDGPALHDALAHLIADAGARERLATAAARAAQTTYSWAVVAAQTRILYDTIAGG